LPELSRPTWVEVNLKAVDHNLKEVRRLVGNKTKIMAIVKADGYGHGAIEIAKRVVKAGVDYLGVASLKEGKELRSAKIRLPILILGYTFPSRIEEVVKYSLTQTVYDLDLIRALDRAAQKLNKKAKVHIKVDTGMGRLGVLPKRVADLVGSLSSLSNLKMEGMFTHFSSADEDEEYTLEQLAKFNKVIKSLERRGVSFPLKHTANSAAIIRFPQTHFNLVRAGIMLYGLSPFEKQSLIGKKVSLKPALSLKTKVISVKELPAGSSVSYGRTYKTKKRAKLAVIPLGYADGFSRLLSNCGEALVRGRRVPIRGRVCMDFSIIEASESIKVGEEVVLIGKQGKEEIKVEEIAKKMKTINYEVVCLIGRRVPRIYWG